MNEFKNVPEEVCLMLLEQAHNTGGTLPPALVHRLGELSTEVDDGREFDPSIFKNASCAQSEDVTGVL